MARTTESAVQGIIETDSDISLTPFIDTASAMVDWLEDQDSDSDLSSSLLELIERWLAAHFYAIRDQREAEKTVGKASSVFQGQTTMNLWATQYGQTAMDLDITGRLAMRAKEAMTGNRRRASITWLGTEYT